MSSTGCSSNGRPADDAQHVARRRLLFERFCQLMRPRLHLLEQPRVLDSDHGLIGEGGDQFDLLVAEGPTDDRVNANTPTGLPSRKSGTPSMVRKPPRLIDSAQVNSASARTSGMWTVSHSRAVRPTSRASGGFDDEPLHVLPVFGGEAVTSSKPVACAWRRKMKALSASHSMLR